MSREKIQKAVDQILASYPLPQGIDFIDLQRLLAAHEPPIDLQASMPKGVFRGVSYQFDSFKWPGSKIGREYSVGLVDRGVRMQTAPAESNSAKQTIVQPVAAPVQPVAAAPAKQRADLDRMPGVARHFLQNTKPANQMLRPVQPIEPENEMKGGVDGDLQGLSSAIDAYDPFTNYGRLLKVLAKIGVECARMSVELGRLFARFLVNLLRLFGIGLQYPEQPQQPPEALSNLEYRPNPVAALEPFSLPQQARGQVEILGRDVAKKVSGQESADLAAEAVERSLVAVMAGRPEELPPGVEGRAELVAAIEKTAAGAAVASAAAAHKPKQIEPIVLLKQAMAAFAAVLKLVEESEKIETAEVKKAKKNLDLALDRRAAAASKNSRDRESATLKFLVKPLEKACAVEMAAVDQAESALAAALEKFPPVVASSLLLGRAEKRKVATAALGAVLAGLKIDLQSVQDSENLKAARALVQTFEAQTLEFSRSNGSILFFETGQLAVQKLADLIASDQKLTAGRAAFEAEKQAEQTHGHDLETVEKATAPRPQ